MLHIVVGGQYGSEGKGAVGAWLARHRSLDYAVRVAGPNAGHSAVDPDGRKWALRQIPVAAVVDHRLQIVIGAGSEIDEQVLAHEVAELEDAGIPVLDRLLIDRSATLLTDSHIRQEQDAGLGSRIGSTAKGVGAARADRVWRTAQTWGEDADLDGHGLVQVGGVDTAALLRAVLRGGAEVMIEGTQGYGLGLHGEHYPQSTSSDCRAVDFASMAGVTPWADTDEVKTWVVCRTHPIRVAGNSGPLDGETSWDSLGEESEGYIQPERTTVTQKVRRVGAWDPGLVWAAREANGGSTATSLALMFFDYWYPELAGETDPAALGSEHRDRIVAVERGVGPVALLGTGPASAIYLEGGR